jgi:membrane-bound serine protease (ClpP class)
MRGARSANRRALAPGGLRRARRAVLLASLLGPVVLLGLAVLAPAEVAEPPAQVTWVRLDDIIGPVSARYLLDAIKSAEKNDAAALVIELDTPGGLDTSMRQIIKAILASKVPVCVYVAPEGARAASAGVYISYSAHVAAMAPGTNLGAATPVSMGGGEMDTTMASKAKHDASAYLQSLAKLRGRNVEWAAQAVEEAVSLPAEDAVKANVVDLIATGPKDLLAKMDGRMTKVASDSSYVIRTAGAEIVQFSMSLRYRILSTLNNPNVAICFSSGLLRPVLRAFQPGVVLPGVLGASA